MSNLIAALVESRERLQTFSRGEFYNATPAERARLSSAASATWQTAYGMAHQAYRSWPKAKQVVIERELRRALGNKYSFGSAGVQEVIDEVKTGRPSPYRDLWGGVKNPEFCPADMRDAAKGLDVLIKAWGSSETEDAYYAKIKDAVVLLPMVWNIHQADMIILKEDGDGNLPEQGTINLHHNDIGEIDALIQQLIGQKVIFFPIENQDQTISFYDAHYKPEMPFEFEVYLTRYVPHGREIDRKSKPLGKLTAQVYNPLTETDAINIAEFFAKLLPLAVIEEESIRR